MQETLGKGYKLPIGHGHEFLDKTDLSLQSHDYYFRRAPASGCPHSMELSLEIFPFSS